MLMIHPESHLDHGLNSQHLGEILRRFGDREKFFIETFVLTPEFLLVPSGLYGPACGDKPIEEEEVFYAKRGDRPYESRLVKRQTRLQDKLTVIAGPLDNWKMISEDSGESLRAGEPKFREKNFIILYSAFGGPISPKEVGDLTNVGDRNKEESRIFWSQHALVAP
jgi:hypothetical protein